ncbi:hypothetical protein VKT23_009651 [Stygiomarasmius scandens]|uniref:C2H2-type domain-containing protein n=1 Tax=Marasmiellus scandens TaxID=2682957 RepID=A0ABR1JGX0_9AGAR
MSDLEPTTISPVLTDLQQCAFDILSSSLDNDTDLFSQIPQTPSTSPGLSDSATIPESTIHQRLWNSDSFLAEAHAYPNPPAANIITREDRNSDVNLLTSLMSLEGFLRNTVNDVSSTSGTPEQSITSESDYFSHESSGGRSDVEGGVKRGTRQTRRNSNASYTDQSDESKSQAGSSNSKNKTNQAAKKRVKCSLCDETFTRKHDMMRHEVNFLSIDKPLSIYYFKRRVSMAKNKIGLVICAKGSSQTKRCFLFINVLD